MASVLRMYGTIDLRMSINRNSPAGKYIWKFPTDDKDRVVKLRKPQYRRQKINQFDLNGVFIKDYESLKAAKEAVPGLQHNAPLTGGSSAGFRWKYASDHTPFTKKTKKDARKKVNQYDLDMNLVETHESYRVAQSHYPGIHYALNNFTTYKGYLWKYA